MSKKKTADLIREVSSEEQETRTKATKGLKVVKDPAEISKNEDRVTFLDDENKDWVACLEGVKELRDSGSDADANALIKFAQLLFSAAKGLSYVGTEDDVEIRKQEIKAYERVLNVNPNHGACLNNQGITYMQLKDWSPAVEAFQRAIKAEPGYEPQFPAKSSYYTDAQTKAFANLAVSLWNNKQFEEALEAIEEAANRSSEHAGTRDYMRQNTPFRKITIG